MVRVAISQASLFNPVFQQTDGRRLDTMRVIRQSDRLKRCFLWSVSAERGPGKGRGSGKRKGGEGWRERSTFN